MDSTGVGEPIYDRLDGIGLKVKGVSLTNVTKDYLITSLSIAIEKREITFPDIPELLQELYVFSAEKTASGKIRYSAPSGYHDDIVVSMALAVAEITDAGNGYKFIGIGQNGIIGGVNDVNSTLSDIGNAFNKFKR